MMTLNRPASRNAIDQPMWLALQKQLDTLAATSDVQLVVIQGAQGAFSAGADIAELRQHLKDREWMSANQALIQQVNRSLAALPQLTIAAIDGPCVGGGLGLAVACDVRVATERSVFALTPARLGLSYSLADTKRLVDLIGDARARELLLLGDKIPASAAHRFNLLNQVVADDQLQHAVMQLIQRASANSAHAIATIKSTLARIRAGQRDDDEQTRAAFAAAFDHPDFERAADAFLDATESKP